MKKLILLISLSILFVKQDLLSQYLNNEHFMVSIGIKDEIPIGLTDSKFINGIGFSFETYIHAEKVAVGLFGFDYYQNKNIVEGDELQCKFWTFYFVPLDYKVKLFRPTSGRCNFYFGPSIAPQIMKVEGVKGVDWCWLVNASLGMQYAYSEKGYFQLQVKPYFIIKNQLNNKGGLELKLSLGFMP